MVELKARFDEAANIHWAKVTGGGGGPRRLRHPRLEDARQGDPRGRAARADQVREYVHIGTGNYNSKTARLYTDLGLFTADSEIGADVAEMFNFLTGYGRPAGFRKVLVAPTTMRDRLLGEIERTIAAHRAGEDARIALKMNALVDARMHPRALRGLARRGPGRAERARDLLPAPGRARRLREHPRASRSSVAFSSTRASTPSTAARSPRSCIGSADLMPRNLDHRVELVTRSTTRPCATRCWMSWSAASPTTRTPGSSTPMASGQTPTPEVGRRSVQDELRERHGGRAAEQLAAAAG